MASNSGQQLRPAEGVERPHTPTRRLNLHIPNVHPRATSPRSSPQGSPVPEVHSDCDREAVRGRNEDRAGQDTTDAASPSAGRRGIILGRESNRDDRFTTVTSPPLWSQYFRTEITSGESSRDFLARERTYFSWLRLATFLAIASVALFLRLRLRSFTNGASLTMQTPSTPFPPSSGVTHKYARALAQKALRKRTRRYDSSAARSSKGTLLTPSNHTQSASWHSAFTTMLLGKPDDTFDTSASFANVLGSLFLVLSLLALCVGHWDYMRCERALEEADKLIVPFDGEQGNLGSLTKWHNARSAKQAHSNVIVRIVEIVISAAVFATALIILITGNQGQIAPLPGGRF